MCHCPRCLSSSVHAGVQPQSVAPESDTTLPPGSTSVIPELQRVDAVMGFEPNPVFEEADTTLENEADDTGFISCEDEKADSLQHPGLE